jgi:predicted benzoate:H+ symporter BenE
MMQGFGFERYFYAMAAIAVISAIIILVGAIMVYNQPSKAPTWGALILASSILSLLGMGGFFFGAILGVVGGILALTWRQAKN